MAEQKARQEGNDENVSVKEKVAAAKRTDKAAREFFAMSPDDIDKVEM